MKHAAHGHRLRAGILAAAGLIALAGCTSTAPQTNSAVSASSSPGGWNSTQVAAAENTLEGPPVGDSTTQSACIVKIASKHISYQDFAAFVSYLQSQGTSTTPSSAQAAQFGTLANETKVCGAL